MRITLIITSMLMAGLSLDLLYLYFAGAWYEPNPFILWTELALLFIFVIAGLVIAFTVRR
uniref:Uncharacterized protein n=1 Tax=viral metagenome TaxID=1070528 RepID=A0A6M3KZH4_9ZZZZ